MPSVNARLKGKKGRRNTKNWSAKKKVISSPVPRMRNHRFSFEGSCRFRTFSTSQESYSVMGPCILMQQFLFFCFFVFLCSHVRVVLCISGLIATFASWESERVFIFKSRLWTYSSLFISKSYVSYVSGVLWAWSYVSGASQRKDTLPADAVQTWKDAGSHNKYDVLKSIFKKDKNNKKSYWCDINNLRNYICNKKWNLSWCWTTFS